MEAKNYVLDYYLSKKNLNVDFTEELAGNDSSMQGDENKTSPYELSSQQEKELAKSLSQAASGTNPLELEGSLKVISDAPSTGSFDDVVKINFTKPLMDSPTPPNL